MAGGRQREGYKEEGLAEARKHKGILTIAAIDSELDNLIGKHSCHMHGSGVCEYCTPKASCCICRVQVAKRGPKPFRRLSKKVVADKVCSMIASKLASVQQSEIVKYLQPHDLSSTFSRPQHATTNLQENVAEEDIEDDSDASDDDE